MARPIVWLEAKVVDVTKAESSDAAGWALLAVVVAILVFEAWAVLTGRPTISQWVKRKTGGRAWWRWFGLTSIGLLLWHLFFGGPL